MTQPLPSDKYRKKSREEPDREALLAGVRDKGSQYASSYTPSRAAGMDDALLGGSSFYTQDNPKALRPYAAFEQETGLDRHRTRMDEAGDRFWTSPTLEDHDAQVDANTAYSHHAYNVDTGRNRWQQTTDHSPPELAEWAHQGIAQGGRERKRAAAADPVGHGIGSAAELEARRAKDSAEGEAAWEEAQGQALLNSPMPEWQHEMHAEAEAQGQQQLSRQEARERRFARSKNAHPLTQAADRLPQPEPEPEPAPDPDWHLPKYEREAKKARAEQKARQEREEKKARLDAAMHASLSQSSTDDEAEVAAAQFGPARPSKADRRAAYEARTAASPPAPAATPAAAASGSPYRGGRVSALRKLFEPGG